MSCFVCFLFGCFFLDDMKYNVKVIHDIVDGGVTKEKEEMNEKPNHNMAAWFVCFWTYNEHSSCDDECY